MLAWESSGFSIDASVRIAIIDRDVPSYFQSLEHLLRYCARPPFALERLSVIRDAGGRIIRIRYLLPRHKAANWVGPGRGRTFTRSGANGVVDLSPFEFLDRLADLVPPPRKHRHRYHGVFAPNHKLRRAVTALAIGNVGKRQDAATGGHPDDGRATGGCCDAHRKPRSHDTSRIAWAKLMARVGEEFPLECPACGGDIRLIAFITEPGTIRKILTHLDEPLEPPPVSPARGPPTDWDELVQAHDDRAFFQATDRRAARDRHSQPLSGAGCDPRMSGNCELGRGLRSREKNATEAGAGRFEKPAPDAKAAPPEAHESLISRKTVEEVPLTGLSFERWGLGQRLPRCLDSLARYGGHAREVVPQLQEIRRTIAAGHRGDRPNENLVRLDKAIAAIEASEDMPRLVSRADFTPRR